MRPKVLVTTQMMINDQPRFRERLIAEGLEPEFVVSDQFLSEARCLELSPIYDGWISGDDEITSAVLERLTPKLKVISKWGSGIDSIDGAALESFGVALRYSPGAFADSVAEMALGYLLCLTRDILVTDRQVRAGAWPKPRHCTLAELRIGILGMGAIGRAFAALLPESSVIYHDPYVSHDVYRSVALEELFNISNVVVITCPLNRATANLVNRRLIEKTQRGFYLINVSRGAIVCEADLIKALNEGVILGAALDVFSEEPISESHPCKHMPNVILGSHNANNTFGTVEFVHNNTISQLVDALNES